jgi:hypothetical protein
MLSDEVENKALGARSNVNGSDRQQMPERAAQRGLQYYYAEKWL